MLKNTDQTLLRRPYTRTKKMWSTKGQQLQNCIGLSASPKQYWSTQYIDLHTEISKQTENEFEKDFFKLMNSAMCW